MGMRRAGRIGDANGGNLGVEDAGGCTSCPSRDGLRLGNEAERSEDMDENGRLYWEVVQERHLERPLAMELVEIGGRVKDAAAFKEAYGTEVNDFMMRHGKLRAARLR